MNNEYTTAMIYQIEFNGLPFKAIDNQVIYVESRYDESINKYIKSHYDTLYQAFNAMGLEFCYSHNIIKSSANLELLRYLAPHQTDWPVVDVDSSALLKYLSDKTLYDKIEPSLIVLSKNRVDPFGDRVVFNAVTIDVENISSYERLLTLIRSIADADKQSVIATQEGVSLNPNICGDAYYCCEHDEKPRKTKKNYFARIGSLRDLFRKYDIEEDDDWGTVPQYVPAENDTAEVRKLLRELREVVDKLKERGVNSYWIECLINDHGKLSKLVITRDYRIVLPDYNNMEISMTPIVKAVYLLFLRHPEGINYKDLVDYRDELASIYVDIKGAPLDAKMEQSVVRATNPLDNSINEKVARIREAFVSRFDEHMATNYIIHGSRGEAKRIPLHRELVEWQ